MFKSITFEVIGDKRLVCEGCEERVENALKSLHGVGKVRAKSSNQRIEILFDAALLDVGAIVERIGTVGYQTRIVGSTSDSADPARSYCSVQQITGQLALNLICFVRVKNYCGP